MTIKRVVRKNPARVPQQHYRVLWSAIEGSVREAFKAHPEYLTEKGAEAAVASVTKRAVGAVVGLMHEAGKRNDAR